VIPLTCSCRNGFVFITTYAYFNLVSIWKNILFMVEVAPILVRELTKLEQNLMWKSYISRFLLNTNTMIRKLFLVAIITASFATVIVTLVTTAIPGFAQNVTYKHENGTAATNSTSSEERGAYSDYGGAS
jgi:hypothetical protein